MTVFGSADTRSIRFLNKWRNLFLDHRIKHSQEGLIKFIEWNYFQNGAALFGRQTPEDLQDFRLAAMRELDDVSDEETYLIIEYAIQRIRNYAHIESLSLARLESMRIVASIPCLNEVCSSSEGEIIAVKSALESVWALIDGRKDSLIAEFPPFYPGCRCRVEGIVPGSE